MGRMRTGTPPRLNKLTIDYEGLEAQHSDEHIKWFSFENEFSGY
jgi:tRNA U34 5-carboxymethylaminomethyl modifying enzyme MnmG/GidA